VVPLCWPIPLKFTVTFPNGATLPVGLTWSVPLAALITEAVPVKLLRVIGVVVWPTVMFPAPDRVKVPALEVLAVNLKV
jgi:hypothetical protein